MMARVIFRFLFPREFRTVPARRLVLNLFRALHILSLAIYMGGHYFNQPTEVIGSWFLWVILSGLALLFVDLYRSCIILFELRGLFVVAKVLALLSLPWLEFAQQFWLLVLLVFASAYISHAPRGFRHYTLLPDSWQQRLGTDHGAQLRRGRGPN